MKKVNEFFIKNTDIFLDVDTNLLKWLTLLIDPIEEDWYFPFENLEKWILEKEDISKYEYIKNKIEIVVNKVKSENSSYNDIKRYMIEEFKIEF